MVTVFLRGGLGNQMFQYAAGLALAKRNRTQLVLDTTYLHDRFPRRQFSYRTYDLGVFSFEPRLTLFSKISSEFSVPGFWLGLDLAFIKTRDMFGMCRIVKEKDEHTFDPAVLAVRGSVLLWGRWQSEKYFAGIADEVRAAFRFRNALSGDATRSAEEIARAGEGSVSLHVRRGDYAAFKRVEQLHGKTDLGYYERAEAYLGARVRNPHFFIFSDDISWCRENLRLRFPATFVKQSAAGPHDVFHLELMSRCRHHVITNSTFSWWGAWLNADRRKLIVAPARWYADPAIKSDIIPEGWIKL